MELCTVSGKNGGVLHFWPSVARRVMYGTAASFLSGTRGTYTRSRGWLNRVRRRWRCSTSSRRVCHVRGGGILSGPRGTYTRNQGWLNCVCGADGGVLLLLAACVMYGAAAFCQGPGVHTLGVEGDWIVCGADGGVLLLLSARHAQCHVWDGRAKPPRRIPAARQSAAAWQGLPRCHLPHRWTSLVF